MKDIAPQVPEPAGRRRWHAGRNADNPHLRRPGGPGLSNRQVASRVFLSTHTVAFHLCHVFWKLGVTSRVQLARMAAEQAATG